MSLVTQLQALSTRIGTEFKSLRTLINGNTGGLGALTTTAKGNLVLAINEVHAGIGGAGASINDATVSTVSVWSSSKTSGEIQAAVTALINGAPGALDTLKELADALAASDSADDAAIAALVTSIAEKVSLTGAETIAGVKTFSSAPVVPDGSFTTAKVTGLDTALASKITGFADPNADRIVFWDDSASAYAALTLSGLSITGTSLSVSAASTAVAGVMAQATSAETITGTVTNKAVTPAGLLAAVGATGTDFVPGFEAALL